MKSNIRKKEKGAIAIFVLIGLLFMSAFLILLFAGNINQEKDMKEQSNITSQIYSGEGEQGAYDQAFGDLRRKNKKTLTAEVTDSAALPLERTFGGTLSNYRIYGNSIQDGTPSPENPVEIQSVGDKTKNLFNINDYVPDKYQDGLIVFNASELEIGKTYTLSSNKPIYWFKISDQWSGYNSVQDYQPENGITEFTFTMTRNENLSETATQYIMIGNPNADYKLTELTDISQLNGYEIQIEEGETATAYEPYGYKIPIKISTETSNYTNLFDFFRRTDYEGTLEFGGSSTIRKFEFDKIYIGITGNNYYSKSATYYTEGESIFVSSTFGGYGIGLPFHVKPNTTYTILNPNGANMAIGEYDKDGNWLKWDSFGKRNTFITSNKTEVLTIILRPTATGEYVEYKNIQFYEEPVENIYLDEPLRKVGEDADYIDFKTGKVVRPVKEKIFTGEEKIVNGGVGWAQWPESITSKSMGVYYNSYDELGKYNSPLFKNNIGLSSHFVIQTQGVQLSNDSLIGKAVILANPNPPYFGFKVPYTTKDAWLQFLKDEYSANRPLKVHYVLLIPTEETINLPELPAFEDDSKIEVLTQIAPSKITAEYEGYTIE